MQKMPLKTNVFLYKFFFFFFFFTYLHLWSHGNQLPKRMNLYHDSMRQKLWDWCDGNMLFSCRLPLWKFLTIEPFSVILSSTGRGHSVLWYLSVCMLWHFCLCPVLWCFFFLSVDCVVLSGFYWQVRTVDVGRKPFKILKSDSCVDLAHGVETGHINLTVLPKLFLSS